MELPVVSPLLDTCLSRIFEIVVRFADAVDEPWDVEDPLLAD
jgi:hypothetical protein